MVESSLYEQFLLLPQSFQWTCSADMYELRFLWDRVTSVGVGSIVCITNYSYALLKTIVLFQLFYL